MLGHLKASSKLFADETTAPVLDPGRGRTKTGQLFAYALDDRPFAGGSPPTVAYVYAPDRKAERPIAHLKGFAGILQVDGYGGYKVLAEKADVQLALIRRSCHFRDAMLNIAVAFSSRRSKSVARYSEGLSETPATPPLYRRAYEITFLIHG